MGRLEVIAISFVPHFFRLSVLAVVGGGGRGQGQNMKKKKSSTHSER